MSDSEKYIVYINGTTIEVSREVYDYLKQSDRRIKYAEQDRKRENQ